MLIRFRPEKRLSSQSGKVNESRVLSNLQSKYMNFHFTAVPCVLVDDCEKLFVGEMWRVSKRQFGVLAQIDAIICVW